MHLEGVADRFGQDSVAIVDIVVRIRLPAAHANYLAFGAKAGSSTLVPTPPTGGVGSQYSQATSPPPSAPAMNSTQLAGWMVA